ncbi:MAG: 3-hydroxyacyl-CoA dehydrogenase family protein [Dehalococcoidia bacterium]
MEIERVGVAGFGLMGGGIAQVCAVHGYNVTVLDVDDERVSQGHRTIRGRLERDVSRGRMTADTCERAISRIEGTTRYEDLAACDLVIEAAVEDLSAKRAVFKLLGEATKPEAILASNTSSLPLSDLAAASGRPGKVIGLHFFNPPYALRLVEVVIPESTNQETVGSAMVFCDSLDRVTVRVKDTPGFIVNRLLVPFIFDAIHLVESGTASAQDVDQACRIGLNHAMGPLATADLIGLDTLLYISESMFEEYGEPRFKAPTSLRRMVALGHLGRKTGKGFFTYE